MHDVWTLPVGTHVITNGDVVVLLEVGWFRVGFGMVYPEEVQRLLNWSEDGSYIVWVY